MVQVQENGYAKLPVGSVIVVSGKSLSDISFVRERAIKDGALVDAKNYAQFALGGRSFTIQDSDQESIDLLKDKQKRKTLDSVTLEATEYDRPVLDENGEATGDTMRVKSFRFISLVTADDSMAYSKTAGIVAQEEAKWAPKATIDMTTLDKRIKESVEKNMGSALDSLLNKFEALAAKQAPAQAPAPEPAEA